MSVWLRGEGHVRERETANRKSTAPPTATRPSISKSISTTTKSTAAAAGTRRSTPYSTTGTNTVVAHEYATWIVDYEGNLIDKAYTPNHNELESTQAIGTMYTKIGQDSGVLTINQVLHMIRSAIVAQRSYHLIVLANIIAKAKQGKFGNKQDSEAILLFLIKLYVPCIVRIALDELKKMQIAAAILCLHALLVNKEELGALDKRFDFKYGPWVQLNASKMKVSSNDEAPTEFQKTALHVYEGLVAMDILPRILYLLTDGKEYLSQESTVQLLQILQVFAIHSSDLVRLLENEENSCFIDVLASFSDSSSDGIKIEGFKLLRILCCTDSDFAKDLYLSFEICMAEYIESFNYSNSHSEKVATEILRLWRVFLLYKLETKSMKILFILSKQLESDLNLPFDDSRFDFIKARASFLESFCFLSDCLELQSALNALSFAIANFVIESSSDTRFDVYSLGCLLHLQATLFSKGFLCDSNITYSLLKVNPAIFEDSVAPSIIENVQVMLDELPGFLDTSSTQAEAQIDYRHAYLRLVLVLEKKHCISYEALWSVFSELLFFRNYNSLVIRFYLQDLFRYLIENSDPSCQFYAQLIVSGFLLFDVCHPVLHQDFVEALFSSKVLENLLFDAKIAQLPESFPREIQWNYLESLKEIDCNHLSSELCIIFTGKFMNSLIFKCDSSTKSISSFFSPITWNLTKKGLSVFQVKSLLQFFVISRFQERLCKIDSNYNSNLDPLELAKVLLYGSEFYLEPSINKCMSVLFERAILDYESACTNFPEFPLYQNLMDSFSSESYGDPVVFRVLVYFIRQKFPVIHRCIFWADISQLIPAVGLDSNFSPPIDEYGYLNPKETDSQVLNLMRDSINCFDDQASFLFKIARAHCL